MLSLPLTYAPVSFTDKAIEAVRKRGVKAVLANEVGLLLLRKLREKVSAA